jgi:hypothetical protein
MASTPERMASTPERMASTPERMASTPERMASVPERMASVPERMASVPEQMASVPERTASAREHRASMRIHVAETMPHIASHHASCYETVMVDPKKFDTLKQILVDATDFSDVYGYFMEHFGSKSWFMAFGEPHRDARFIKLLEHLATKVLGKKGRITEPYLLRVAEFKFVHGAFVFGKHLGNVIFFEDIDKGMVGFGGLNSTGPSELARFTLVQFPDGKKLMLN